MAILWKPFAALRLPRYICFIGFLILPGCTGRPHAPALTNEPVYHNAREGFRFLVPQHWRPSARSELPSGKVDKERQLVRYELFTTEQPAGLEVSRVDLPSSTDLATYLAGASFGAISWKQSSSAEDLQINGTPAVRMVLTNSLGGEERTKDVVIFRRGERVYFFTALYVASDTKAREEIRRAVASTIWK
jgi:hypothetical protein